MRQTTIKELKNGEFFTLKDYGEYPDEKRVYIRCEYDRADKKFACIKWEDVNAVTYKKGSTVVYTDFTF